MLSHEIRNIIQVIIRGSSLEGKADTLTAARNFLCTSFGTSTKVEKDFERQSAIKEEQVVALTAFSRNNNLWLNNFPNKTLYLTEGGEARVYFGTDKKSVIKVNDAVYYPTWLHFLNSLLLHNLIFEDTSYELLGFTKSEYGLAAVLKQPFVIAEASTDLEAVKEFLFYNGFEATRKTDYYNKELGLILEDIHDENVIVNAGKMFFIDTVFYIDVR